MPIYAECGGLMYLTEAIVDFEQRRFPMVGLLPGHSVMARRATLGYRIACARACSTLHRQGESVRGHEFHYSTWEERPASLQPAYDVTLPRSDGPTRPEGACLGNLVASYIHLHFWGVPQAATRFVAACRAFSLGRGGVHV
jgi:cobyrinic acid a,c-diamide synthase